MLNPSQADYVLYTALSNFYQVPAVSMYFQSGWKIVQYVLKGYPLEAKTVPKNRNQSAHISRARPASLCQLGLISDPLIVSKFHNETHDPKGQENKIYTIVKDREMFYRHNTVPDTSCSEVKYVLKRVSFGSKDCTKELKPECAHFQGQTS